MKKHDLWIIVAAAVCAAALLIGSNFIDTTPKNGHLGTPDGITLEFSSTAPKASGSAFSWLFASACAEEAPAEPAEEENAADDSSAQSAEKKIRTRFDPAAHDDDSSAQSAEKKELAPVDLDDETIAKLEAWGLVRAESYLVVWMGDYFQPVPLLEEFEEQQLRVTLSDTDYIVIGVGKNHFNMDESSCPDQVCITEGEVTLENRESRLLGSYIICMPNGIVLEMRSAQEMLELLDESTAQAPEVEIPEEMQSTDETAEAANEEER